LKASGGDRNDGAEVNATVGSLEDGAHGIERGGIHFASAHCREQRVEAGAAAEHSGDFGVIGKVAASHAVFFHWRLVLADEMALSADGAVDGLVGAGAHTGGEACVGD
jgi:hypothetical protein